MSDPLYRYEKYNDERLGEIFNAWDGLGGYHGLQIKEVASLISPYNSLLDVGCGTGHLYEAVKPEKYTGFDVEPRVVELAKNRHPSLDIRLGDALDMDEYGIYDVVAAIGLFSSEPNTIDIIDNMYAHANKRVIFTINHYDKGMPDIVASSYRNAYLHEHNIDKAMHIIVMEVEI